MKKYYVPEIKPTRKDSYGRFIWSRPVNIVCNTDGRGYWSRTAKKVNHKKIELNCWGGDEDLQFAYGVYELRVFFNKKDWDTEKYGLIYTDNNWIKNFRKGFIDAGFSKAAVNNCDFSEQGMQGDNYVSLDAGVKFAKEFFTKLY